jgi:biotin transport system substrate-specific component
MFRPHCGSSQVTFIDEILWSIAGLLLTIGGLFVPAAIVGLPQDSALWQLPASLAAIPIYPLQVTYQIAAVLLVSCMGGRQAATLSQIAYLILGLSGFQIFAQGGDWSYLKEPTFGYLLGFIPAAWICGGIAVPPPRRGEPRTFRWQPSPPLEVLSWGGFLGLCAIHGLGLLYLSLLALFQQVPQGWLSAIWQYSVLPIPGQLVLVCVVAVLARFLRLVLFY